MRLAIFGDIHGNIEALRAAYDACLGRVDAVYHLGDLGGYAPFVNEVVDFLVEHGIEGVQGNYDYNVAHDSEHCGCKYEDPVQAEIADLSFAWTKKHASDKSKQYMRSLPQGLTLTVEERNIHLFHATPHKNNLYWYEDRPEKFFQEMADKTNADVLVYGHTHKPYRTDRDGKVFINAGSVGKPKDRDPRACVTVIQVTGKSVVSGFLRVSYDLEKTAAAIIESGLPPQLAENLRKGI